MKKTYAASAILLALGMVSGCTTTPSSTAQDTEAYAATLLAEKAAVAADAQKNYVALVAEDKSITLQKQNSIETDEVDIDYIGTPQDLLQTFAYRYGYRYIESGSRQRLKNINLRLSKSSPIEVLRNVGNQITSGGDIVLDKNGKLLRLIYKPVTNSANGG